MTNRLLTISVFAALATANMQAQQPVTLKVDVPFNFHVGVTAMPAGEYFISPNLLAQGTLVMRSTTGKASVIVKTVPESIGQPAVQGKVSFARHNEEYFLSKVWSPSSQSVATLTPTKRERELAARGSSSGETVLLARKP
jgi:hypothetical protein